MSCIFHIDNLNFNSRHQYSFCPSLQHLSLDIPAGEHVVLYHPSGYSSALLLYLLSGLALPEEGQITFSDTETFFQVSLFTIQGLLFSWRADYSNGTTRSSPDHTDRKESSLLEKLFTSPVYDAPVQQQALWQDLLQKAGASCDLLLLDRLFRHLDPSMAEQYLTALYELRQNYPLTMVSASTQLSEAILIGSRIYFLGGDPVSLQGEYVLPFDDRLSPAQRIRHRDYHKIYQELSELTEKASISV